MQLLQRVLLYACPSAVYIQGNTSGNRLGQSAVVQNGPTPCGRIENRTGAHRSKQQGVVLGHKRPRDLPQPAVEGLTTSAAAVPDRLRWLDPALDEELMTLEVQRHAHSCG